MKQTGYLIAAFGIGIALMGCSATGVEADPGFKRPPTELIVFCLKKGEAVAAISPEGVPVTWGETEMCKSAVRDGFKR